MDTQFSLKEEFLSLSNMTDTKKLADLIKRMNKYVKETKDEDIYLISTTLKANLDDVQGKSYERCCGIAATVVEWVMNIENFEKLEIAILGMVLHYMPSYQTADSFARKAKKSSNCSRGFADMIHGNMSLRLIRANYDSKTPDEQMDINKLFSHYMGLSIADWAHLPKHPYNIVLKIRQALFVGDCEGITEGLEKLRMAGEKEWLKAARYDVVDYLTKLQDKLTTPLRRLLYGRRIQQRREELGLTVREFAELIDTDPIIVNEFERGANGVSPTRLQKIAKVLKTDIYYLSGNDPVEDNFDGDITLHKLIHVLRSSPEEDKQFVLSFTKSYIRQQAKVRKGM